VIFNGFARFVRADDFPIGIPARFIEQFREAVLDTTADQMSPELDDVLMHAPSLADDAEFRAWWRRAGQQAASPATSSTHFSLLFDVDVRHLLPSIRVPTLIVQRRDGRYVRAAHGRYLAARIANSTYVEVDGADQLLGAGDPEPVVEAIRAWLGRHGLA
jgi:pimeloyl-ACP methyl ester carboxylesterase